MKQFVSDPSVSKTLKKSVNRGDFHCCSYAECDMVLLNFHQNTKYAFILKC